MRRLKCFSFVFILLAAFVLLYLGIGSKQVKAVNLTQNVSYLGTLSANTYNYQYVGSCTVSNGGNQGYVTNNSSSSDTSCSVSSRLNLQSSTGFNDQYVLGITTYVYELRDREPVNSYNNEVPTLELYSGNSYQTTLAYIGTSIQNLSESSASVTQYFKFNTSGNLVSNTSILHLYNRIGLQAKEYMMVGTQVEVLALANYNITVNTNNQDVIDAINQLKDSNVAWQMTINTNIQRLIQIIEDTQDEQQQQQEQEQEDRDNIEQQKEENEENADNAGSEATSTGTSLFGAFTQLLSALTNVNGSSCTLPAMQVYSLNLGNMNLCQFDIPPQIMALVSIGMVFIIVPLGINLVKKMIALYKEITG